MVDANCETLKTFIRDYIKKRVSGEVKSAVGGDADLLTLFLENSEVFTDDVIIDEMIDFQMAAVMTTMKASITMMCHYVKNPESLWRVREEFDKVNPFSEAQRNNFEAEMNEHLTIDTIDDLDFQNMVINETMRF